MTPSSSATQHRIRIVKQSDYFSIHTHSRYSAQDAFSTPEEIVAQAVRLGYPAIALTDHGNIAGSIELYMACAKAGIKAFPGSEMYFVNDRNIKKGPEAKRYHLGLIAYTTQGYRNLVRISTDSHRNFYFKPLIDFADMARYHELGWTEGIALTTGCFFGLVIQTLMNQGREEAKQVVATFASYFDTYVELQNHQIEREGEMDEGEIADALVGIADELGLPVVISQDSHYVHEEERPLHDEFKRLVSYGAGTDDVVFPGDGFHLVDDAWMRRHHRPDHYQRGIAGLHRLLSRHDLRIPEADSYHYRIPSVLSDPDAEIRKRCFAGLARRHLLKPTYLDRLEEEISVVEEAGMGNYIALVTDVCDFMRTKGIFYQTRGSAAGSLICWLMGITNIDPIQWGARFDRFLTKDRKKPPDIDLDVESMRRDEVIAYLRKKFSVVSIGTWGELGMDKKEDGKGSLKVKYFSKRRRVMQAAGETPKPDDWDSVPQADKSVLYQLAKKKAYANYGTHACGMALLNSQTELDDMLPLQWNANKKTFVTQYGAGVVEAIGIVKGDFLGLHLMSVMRVCCENLGVGTEYLDTIPLDDQEVFSMLSRGDTTGVFQFEGYATMLGCKELKPSRMAEVVDAVAIFRPATQNSGATGDYIDRKWGRARVPVRHSLIAKHVGNTRGILLYQDQIIAIIRDLGFDADDVNRILKAVKASNKNVAAAAVEMDYFMPLIEARCREQGMSDADWAWMEHAFAAFANYSFNVAHATVYALCAYRSAWLALHHGVEYHAALLSVASGTDREEKYLKAARRRKITVSEPNLNESAMHYTMSKDKKKILKGFLSLDGVGVVMARHLCAGQPYRSWEDFSKKSVGTKVTGLKEFHEGETSSEQLQGTVRILYEQGMFKKIGQPPLGAGYVKKTRKKKVESDQSSGV